MHLKIQIVMPFLPQARFNDQIELDFLQAATSAALQWKSRTWNAVRPCARVEWRERRFGGQRRGKVSDLKRD